MVLFVFGVYHNLKTNTMRDYSVAGKNYSTPIIVAIIVGVQFGTVATVGLPEQIMTIGILGIVPYVGAVLGFLLTAQFMAPGISKLKDAISIGDVMDHFYGKQARVLAGIATTITCVIVVSTQILGIAILLEYFLKINSSYALFMSSCAVIIYPTLSGIRMLTVMDVVKFTALVITVPMLCNLCLNQIDGYQSLFSKIPQSHLLFLEGQLTYREIFACALLYLIPGRNPAIFQRFLIAKNEKQLKTALYYAALLSLALFLMISCLGFFVLVVIPELRPDLVIPYLINSTLPIGLKGLVSVGILAIILSMADVHLNVAGISLVRDTLKPFLKKPLSDKAELQLTRMLTIFLGISAVIMARGVSSVFENSIASAFLWVPMVLFPLLAGLMGLTVSKRSFILGATAGFITIVIWFFFIQEHVGFNGFFVAFMANGFVFLLNHALEQRKKIKFPFDIVLSFVRSIVASWYRILKFLKQNKPCLPTSEYLLRIASKRVYFDDPPYTAFGVFAFIVYVIPYASWHDVNSEMLPCTIVLRFIGGFSAFFLVVRDHWPEKLKTYLPCYWYGCLLYTLSFLTSFMVLETNVSWKSLHTMLLGLFLLAVLVDWLSFIIITVMGAAFSFLAYVFLGNVSVLSITVEQMEWALFMYGATTAISILFRRRKDKEILERLEMMKNQGAYIAHETLGPLVSIAANAQALSLYLPSLVQGYEAAQKAGYSVGVIPQMHFETLKTLPARINKISQTSLSMTDILLNQIKGFSGSESIECCSVFESIEIALQTYPFEPHQYDLVDWDKKNDFQIPIRQEMLIHVLYNLLKNSLYQIKKEHRGEIKIWTESTVYENRIYFRDSASGIDESELLLIFKPSYTTKKTGNGLGLAFCKQCVESVGGQIRCYSRKDEYVEFIIVFPVVESLKE